MTKVSMVAAMCLALVLGMTGFLAFPAMFPLFEAEWGLSKTAGGVISAAYFVGNIPAAIVLISLTDRVQARTVCISGAVICLLANAGFALSADGVATATFWRVMQGVGLAGLFMPGLRAMTDRLQAGGKARAVAFYTAHFAAGSSLSFLLAGELSSRFGWKDATLILSLGPAAAVLLLLFALRSPVPVSPAKTSPLRSLRAALANRRAMAVSYAYATHGWEMFAFRTWVVAALSAALAPPFAQGATADFGFTPAQIASVAGLVGLPGSLLGAELAVRIGLERAIKASMIATVFGALAIAMAMFLDTAVLAVALIAYGFLTMSDSAALTTAMLSFAKKESEGAQMALHNVLGSGGSLVGPLVAGVLLDFALRSYQIPTAWAFVFVALGSVTLVGFVLIRRAYRAPEVHDAQGLNASR